MKSREALLNLATLDIIIPNGILNFTEENIDNILNKKSRAITFYDELLRFYLSISLSHDSGISDLFTAKAFFQQLEINVEASMVDASNLSVPAPAAQSIYRNPPGKSRSSSATTSPSIPGTPICSSVYKNLNKPSEGTIIYSNTYNLSLDDRNMVVTKRKGCWICVIPLTAPIVFAQTRAHSPALSLNVSTSLLPLIDEVSKQVIISPRSELYAAHHFGKTNLLAGLNDDPAFENSPVICKIQSANLPGIYNEPKRSIYPAVQPVKRNCRKMLNVKTALNVQLRTTNVSPSENTILVSVVLANNNVEKTGSFIVDSIKMNIPHGFVTKYEWTHKNEANEFPMTLHPVDQATFLYYVTILEKPPLPKPDPPQHCPTPSPNSCVSSRRNSVASIFSNTSFEPPLPSDEDQQRPLSVIIKGSPIFEGEKLPCIESEWNCLLDLSSLLNHVDSLSPNKLNRSNQRTLSLTSKFRSPSSASSLSSRSSLYLPTGINTPTVTRSFYSAMMNGYINKQISIIQDNDSLYSINGILSGGRTPMLQNSTASNIENSVVMSFFVNTNIVVGQVFTIQVHVVNKSSHVQNLAIMVPNKKRPNESQIEPFMEETEFLKKYFDVETPEADIVCLENNVRVGPLNPSSSEYVTLHFIAVKESLNVIELIQVVNTDTGFITNLRNVLEILVSKSLPPKNDNKFSDVIMKKQVIIAE
ncbi:16091_t:CDS:2 [Cetraspora pellucida]|uniref:16091_t:CDS:1 n=1 Tax=Cetraspora pellucida TaxID=1433469 RepID=A0A9N8ZYW4_9GLOM|nr:16091_t:CDS:2 [Cetraspora pellucida]